MAASNTAVYAVVDKSKKGKKHSLPQNETAESTLPNSFDSPVYDMTDHSADTPPVPQRDEAFNSEYSMITLDNMYSTVNENTRPLEADQGSTSVMTTKVKRVPKKRLEDENKGCKLFTCVFITIAVVATITLICLAILFAEVLKLKAQTTSMEQPFADQQAANDSSSIMFQLQQLNKTLGHDIQQLNSSIEMVQQDQETSTQELIQTLGNQIQQLNYSIGMVMLDQEMSNNTIWELLAQFRQDIISINQHILAPSCAALIALSPSSPSGYYWVRASNGSAVRVYCDMTRSCGSGVTGGWMRVAELDMTNSSHQCPSELQQTDRNGRTCRIASDSAGCSQDITYSTISEYSKVCGKIRGFQTGTPDSFANSVNVGLASNYVDGVSLTHGQPRQHIWTFAAYSQNRCPCNDRSTSHTRDPPSFVSTDYFCDTGRRGRLNNIALWEQAQCNTNTCCPFNNPPWFYRQLPRPTTDDIDMRVCRDQPRSDEDIQIQVIEIYVQ